MPRQKQGEIHCDFSLTKKIRDLNMPESLYISPYDAGLRYTGDGSVFNG
jgi:hypothetical protein